MSPFWCDIRQLSRRMPRRILEFDGATLDHRSRVLPGVRAGLRLDGPWRQIGWRKLAASDRPGRFPGDPASMNGVGVMTVHHEEEARRATRAIVNATPGFDGVGEAASAEEALELAVALRP